MSGYCAANQVDWLVLEKITGWITKNEATILQSIVSSLSPRSTVIELGCHLGRSSLIIASALPPECVVYCIDIFSDTNIIFFDKFFANTKSLRAAGKLRFLIADTVEAAGVLDEKSVQMVYINANHNHKLVTEEIATWHPKIAPGGYLVCHDHLAIAKATGKNSLNGAYAGGTLWPETIYPNEILP